MTGSGLFRDEKRRTMTNFAHRSSLCLSERRDIGSSRLKELLVVVLQVVVTGVDYVSLRLTFDPCRRCSFRSLVDWVSSP